VRANPFRHSVLSGAVPDRLTVEISFSSSKAHRATGDDFQKTGFELVYGGSIKSFSLLSPVAITGEIQYRQYLFMALSVQLENNSLRIPG
jgi:hypothetical protein